MTKPLIETNPYLRDEALREKLISRSVRTSCGVEGIEASSGIQTVRIIHRKDKKIYKMIKK